MKQTVRLSRSAWSATGAMLLLLLSGCAHGPTFKPVESFPADKALVYFYRPSAYVASGQNYSIKWVESVLGKLQSGSYFTYLAQPGTQTFYYEGLYGFAKLTVELAPGEIYYIRGQPTGFAGSTFKLMQMHPVIGKLEIEECHFAP